MEYLPSYKDDSFLMHHGIKGQKWGVRRFQNPDGSLTKAGTKRYRQERRSLRRDIRKIQRSNYVKTGSVDGKYASKVNKKISTAQRNDEEYQRLSRKVTQAENEASAASNLRDRASKHNMDIAEYEYDKAYSRLNTALTEKEARGKQIADRYLDEYHDAKIKDLGFNDIEQGRKYFEHYNLLNVVYTDSNAGSRNVNRAMDAIRDGAKIANAYRKAHS